MNKSCFYCGGAKGEKTSEEHVISRAVLTAIFGDPIKSVSRSPVFGGKTLQNHEQTIKDVCAGCNSALSSYDSAGVDLVSAVHRFHDARGQEIPFSENILGWLIKTHLNFMRVIKDAKTGMVYPVDEAIRSALVNRTPVPHSLFALFLEGLEGYPELWDFQGPEQVQYFYYRSGQEGSQEIVISELRVKAINTVLLIPANSSHEDFEARAFATITGAEHAWGRSFQPVDIDSAVRTGRVRIESIIPRGELHRLTLRKKPAKGA